MTSIDWSKAPESASHFDPATGLFYRLHAGTEWEFFVNASQGWCDSSDWQGRKEAPDRVIARPLPWAPGALPPVGTVCESLWSSTTGEYVSVLILAHDEGRAVYRITSGERKGEYGSDTQHTNFGDHLPVFRQIRTAEQIAAQQREALELEACTEIEPKLDGYNVDLDCSAAIRMTIHAMIEAGYRKVQP